MNLAKETQLNHPVEIMRFTLIYDGPLHAQSTHNAHVDEKHAIRRKLHPQLQDVWDSYPAMEAMKEMREGRWEQGIPEAQRDKLTVFPLNGFNFLPLVSKRAHLLCELDILFLRREPIGSVVNNAGDIDNRVKILFGALRRPFDSNELPATVQPSSSEQPFFYVLLDDDRRITTVRIESEQLIDADSYQKPHDVRLVIRVTIKAQRVTLQNVDML